MKKKERNIQYFRNSRLTNTFKSFKYYQIIFEVIRLLTVLKNFEPTEWESNVDHYSTRTRKNG